MFMIDRMIQVDKWRFLMISSTSEENPIAAH